MDITVYLPDEIRAQAKVAGLNLSGLLRQAVIEELERSQTVEATLQEAQVWEVDVEDEEGNVYTGRINGTLIAEEEHASVYLTEDERVLLHDGENNSYWEIKDPTEELRDLLSDGPYAKALIALGEKPIIDL